MASTARDIPRIIRACEESFATTGRNVIAPRKFDPLPTPPNSVSTSLPKFGSNSYETSSITAQLALEGLEPYVNIRNHCSSSRKVRNDDDRDRSSRSDAIRDITPALLAQHHLPNILLEHGPLAICHIMGFLTIDVPGFSRIPPTKARRLVVSALKARSSTDNGGASNDGVIFEKVGRGRWEAKSKGCASTYPSGNQQPLSLITSALSLENLVKADKEQRRLDRTRLNTPSSIQTDDSNLLQYDDEVDVHIDDVAMMRNDTDKMSIDGDEVCSFSESEDDGIMSDEFADMTDDEDWAALGAAALRAASYSMSNPRNKFISSFAKVRKPSRSEGPSVSVKAKSNCKISFPNTDITSFEMNSNSLEREAIEALLRLGSV
ncbi:hypothetical protein K3495_g12659 [Podosphaera aphanis]|nr:hypothetical protein K3495_g12659 [Podosphaera aphanis]